MGVEETKESQSFETVKKKVAQITRWWDLTAEYLEKNSTKLGDAVQKILKESLPENVEVVQSEIEAFLQAKAAEGEKADFIFMDLDKPMYAGCYKLVMEKGLLAPGGIML